VSRQFLRAGENTPNLEPSKHILDVGKDVGKKEGKHSFTKFERLIFQADFKTLFAKGLRIRAEKFDVRYLLKKHGDPSRLGLSVSKKVGIAVLRNTLKRIIREWFRLNKHRFTHPMDLVFCLRNTFSKQEIKNFQKKIEHLTQEF
jgi:ribonuclease P protein component